MPTYDYKCAKCDHTWELFQSITANPIKKCPSCGANRAKRLIGTGAGIIFKGSGFYQTDYRSASYKDAQQADQKSESSSSSDASSSKSSTDKSSTSEKSSGEKSTDTSSAK
ncbi:MAG: zinc ribbon domain-containing protein [Planctomycetota bacterium]|nr:zinc ribbon domain-containing protein [Planctomycetota bacterium]MDA1213474.1 zinc ribbon domain-containing protein [Planctomycetota bacterium]